jgi:hypothetical protein
MSRIEDIINDIKKLEEELLVEIQRKEEEFYYKIKGKKILFEEEAKKYQKQFVIQVSTYIFNASFLNILTVPLIWLCLIPAIFLDIAVSLYQSICFNVYKIPKVKRSKYIIIDRNSLRYLNIIEKINCVYCGYFNGLISYIQEIAARTEQYWCPIKHARKLTSMHSRYHKFLEYGDCKDYQKRLKELRLDFKDLEEDENNRGQM